MPGFYLKNVIVGSRDLYHSFLNIVIKANEYLPLVYWLKVCLQKFSWCFYVKCHGWKEYIVGTKIFSLRKHIFGFDRKY